MQSLQPQRSCERRGQQKTCALNVLKETIQRIVPALVLDTVWATCVERPEEQLIRLLLADDPIWLMMLVLLLSALQTCSQCEIVSELIGFR